MSELTTHVMDTANGVPAKHMSLRLMKLDGNTRTTLVETKTNSDGRCDSPLLDGNLMKTGVYELEFEAEQYFGNSGGNAFLNCVVLRFGTDDSTSHFHVPLLVSPFSYSTYRGSQV